MAYILPRLDFDDDALEPFDKATMKIHHLNHHAAYINSFNEAIENTDLEQMRPSDIFAEISVHPATVRNKGELLITSTSNQDNPLMDTKPIGGIPILCLDIREHAYYLKYRDNRSGFINAFWNMVNWKKVAELYNK